MNTHERNPFKKIVNDLYKENPGSPSDTKWINRMCRDAVQKVIHKPHGKYWRDLFSEKFPLETAKGGGLAFIVKRRAIAGADASGNAETSE